jgi:hypothetical protein
MAFTPGYEYDIFISYAHVDNVVFAGQTNGWIEQFYVHLKKILARRFGRPDMVEIWWDQRILDPNTLFDHAIQEGIRKSAIMICLNSPGYSASDFCRKELDLFHSKSLREKTGLKAGSRSRFINVLLNNIPYKDWPRELEGTTGFVFHDARDARDFGDTVDTLSNEFKTEMQNLKDSIWELLNDFKNIQTQAAGQPEKSTGTGQDPFTIYMGEVADTLRKPRTRVIAELEKKGFKVIAGIPPPDDEAAHEQATTEALKKANLAIHMLDDCPGRDIPGTADMWYPQKQTELALLSGKPQIIWVPKETKFSDIEDQHYQDFLNKLENGKTTTRGYEFVRGSKSELAQEIIDFAESLKAKAVPEAAGTGNPSVLLDTHYNDQDYAIDLYNSLLENRIRTFINPQEDDPRKNINLLGERIRQVKKLIFLYGSVSKEWVRERMSAALQLIITNNYPIDDFFIYMAPPHKDTSDPLIIQRFLKVNVIDSSNDKGLNKVLLQQLIHDLTTNII